MKVTDLSIKPTDRLNVALCNSSQIKKNTFNIAIKSGDR